MASSTVKDHVPAVAPAQQGPAFSSSSSSAAQLAEDESRKKNTDCVYFLASPLTCKKGSECEYRHSEYARVNPRDCWYWLNGNCLNPKCSFRHPPLDTLLGTPGDNHVGSSVPVSSSATVGSSLPPSRTAPPAAYHSAKPTVPCVFYQQGYCMKGDRCPFSHGQNPVADKATEFTAAAKISESSRFNTAAGGFQRCPQLKNPPQANVSKSIEAAVPTQLKTSVNAVKAVPRNGAFAAKSLMLQHNIINENLHKHNETSSHSLNNGSSKNKSSIVPQASSRDEQRFQSSKEAADELVRESSPGFDVLVDDELGDGDYYGNDEQFPRMRGREGRDLNEFEMGRPDRYKSSDDYEAVAFSDRHGYEIYKPVHERRPRDSSEGSQYDRTRNSDLRQRLSKQRRTNGLSSVVSDPAYPSENLREETRHRSSYRDSRCSPPPRSMISSRLQGRIKLPGQATPVNPPIIMSSEREYDRGRNHSRLSPSRPHLPSHRGRLQDRLRLKVQDDIIGRDAVLSRKDVLDCNSIDFTAPKSLAELKKGKQSHRSEEFTSLGMKKAFESSRHSDDDVTFEPPKPLSEILKRKRKAEDKNEETAVVEKKPPNEEQESNHVGAHNPDHDKTKPSTETQISEVNHGAEGDEGLIADGVKDGHGQEEEECYEEGDGAYEDEQEGGGEGYNLEGENRELPEFEEEYMDEDEEDSFAKKIGVMFS